MYQDHFGLQRHLFEEGIAQGVDVFLGPPQKLAVTNLGVALTLRDSFAVLTGPAGVGKTTLAAHTLRALTTRLALGWVGTAPATGHELLEMLLTEFGFSPYKNSRVERLQMWRQYLNEMRATDTRVCVLVESAENLQPDVLASLESLTAADPNGCPGANVVLTSRTALTDVLAGPALAALKQRTRLRWNLEPLTRVELRDYLAHCITAAGGKTLKLFTDDAVDALLQYSGGIIRTANNLCATALTLAASAREPQVNAPLITQVAVDVFGLAPAPPAAATPWPTVEQAEAGPRATQPPTPAATISSTPAAPSTPRGAAQPPAPAVTPRATPPLPPSPPLAPRAATSPPPSPTVAPRATTPPPATPPPSLAARPTPPARPSTIAPAPTISPAPVAAPSTAARASSFAPAATVAPPSTPVAPAPPPPRATVSPAAASPSTAPSAPAPAPSMAPSQSLAARVAATRAAQAAAAPAQQPTPAMKPAAPPATSAKPAVHAPPPPVMPSSTAAQVPTAAKTPPPKPVLERSAAKPEADVPVLTIEFESSPEVAPKEEEFSFDMALSAGQIDEVLGNDSPEVPVLTDVDSASDDATSPSMIMEFDEETQHQLANLEALANAKALEDISNSMAETLFGDAELDKLAATLALATGKHDDKSKDGEPAPAKSRTAP